MNRIQQDSLSRITLFPVKALFNIVVESYACTATGALESDRQFALLDDSDRYIYGKRHPDVHQIVTC